MSSSLTRQHFEAIADELRRQRPDAADVDPFARTPWESGCYDEWCTVVLGIASTLRQFNGMFDRAKFYAQCGFAS